MTTITTHKGARIDLTERDVARIKARIAKCVVEESTGCVIWDGEIAQGGYGRMWIRGANRRIHRVSYEVHVGQIPSGLVIDHLCRNRRCVNHAHLEPVTPAENMRRSPRFAEWKRPAEKTLIWDTKVLLRMYPRSHCANGHELVPDNIFYRKHRPAGAGYCRKCALQYHAKRRQAKRQAQGVAT